MKKSISAFAFTLILSAIAAPPVTADTTSDALSTCMADNTTGKDRKDLARWIFVAVTAHPEINRFSSVTESDRDDADKTLASLVTRLLTESCRSQAKLAMEKGGNEAFKTAFEGIGKLAMQELMSDPSVNASFIRYAKYLDKAKFESAFSK